MIGSSIFHFSACQDLGPIVCKSDISRWPGVTCQLRLLTTTQLYYRYDYLKYTLIIIYVLGDAHHPSLIRIFPFAIFITHQSSPFLSRMLLRLGRPRSIRAELLPWRALPFRPPTCGSTIIPILILIAHLSKPPQRLIIVQFPASLLRPCSFSLLHPLFTIGSPAV